MDTAAAVADHGESALLVRHLDSAVQGTVPALLDEVRAVGHPRTVQVLVALAAAHPDPALAKAVRRAAFQVHTGERDARPRRRGTVRGAGDDSTGGAQRKVSQRAMSPVS